MAAKNDVTGDSIKSRVNTKKYQDNWDRIFNKENKDLNYESDNPLERPYEPTIDKGWTDVYENK